MYTNDVNSNNLKVLLHGWMHALKKHYNYFIVSLMWWVTLTVTYSWNICRLTTDWVSSWARKVSGGYATSITHDYTNESTSVYLELIMYIGWIFGCINYIFLLLILQKPRMQQWKSSQCYTRHCKYWFLTWFFKSWGWRTFRSCLYYHLYKKEMCMIFIFTMVIASTNTARTNIYKKCIYDDDGVC